MSFCCCHEHGTKMKNTANTQDMTNHIILLQLLSFTYHFVSFSHNTPTSTRVATCKHTSAEDEEKKMC